jgi:RNA polymerase sigma-70 factor (ECF subfamily)
LEVLTSSVESVSGLSSKAAAVGSSLILPEDECVSRFFERLRLFAARRLNDATAAEDIAQETLRLVVDAIRSDRIQDVEALPGFVFQTARNLCMHWVRSTVREKAAFARFERESSDAPRRPDALTNLISAERARDVKRAIDRLATDDQRLLGMIYYDALDTDEIAGRVGITAAAVRVRKHRALQRLAAQLGETT